MNIDQIKPTYENITEYIVNNGSYELHIDFDSALINGKVGNPRHIRLNNIIQININGENINFKDKPESLAYLKKHIEIVL